MPRSAKSRHHRRGHTTGPSTSMVHEVPVTKTDNQYFTRDIQVVRRHVIKSHEDGVDTSLTVDELRSGAIVLRDESGSDRVFLYPDQARGVEHVLRKRRR
jgi:hypothetical protein